MSHTERHRSAGPCPYYCRYAHIPTRCSSIWRRPVKGCFTGPHADRERRGLAPGGGKGRRHSAGTSGSAPSTTLLFFLTLAASVTNAMLQQRLHQAGLCAHRQVRNPPHNYGPYGVFYKSRASACLIRHHERSINSAGRLQTGGVSFGSPWHSGQPHAGMGCMQGAGPVCRISCRVAR